MCPPRGIVLQARGLVDHSFGNSARALVFDIRSRRCRRRSLRDRRHWAAGLRVDVGLQNEGRRFGTRRLGNLTDWRTGGESRYLLRHRRDAHSRSRRCGWSAPLLRQNEPQGRNADDRQRSNDYDDDQAHFDSSLVQRRPNASPQRLLLRRWSRLDDLSRCGLSWPVAASRS